MIPSILFALRTAVMSISTRFATSTALALTLVLSSIPAPAFAEKGGGKPDWAGDKGGHGKPDNGHGKPDKGGKGSRERSNDSHVQGGAGGIDASGVLAAGATAALVSALLGGQTQPLAVGAKPLPPGIQKNLARGKPLPPGIAKQRLPQSLSVRLPVVDGHDWVRIGTELVLVGIATNLVAQVIHNVFN
jgi:hypothetical protein